MAENYAGPIFLKDGKVKEGDEVIPGEERVKLGRVNGPLVINTKYSIDDALRAIGLKEGKKSVKKEYTPVPKPGTGYSGRLNHRDSERIGEVAYRMMRNEIEAAGYSVVELPEDEMLRRYNNANGAEDITLGGNTIYITKGRASEKKAEIAFHEYRAAELVKEKGGKHTDYHPTVEKEQGPATEEYMRCAMRALMN